MPGENCAVFGCGSCRRTKGIGIWKLPLAKDEAHAKWREEWLSEIKKTREIDQNFRELIKHDRVYTCQKHFAPKDIEICEYDTYNSFDLRLYTTHYTLTLVCLYLQLEGIPILIWPYFCTYSYLRENDQEKAAIWCITDIECAQKDP